MRQERQEAKIPTESATMALIKNGKYHDAGSEAKELDCPIRMMNFNTCYSSTRVAKLHAQPRTN